MALVSPGVQVSVVDESFYTPAQPGTLPMIFVTSASNKANGSNTGTAPGTLAINAGIPYLITSQRDLVDTFGDPLFQVDNNNNPIHGSELNEYGLQAAYSFLGIANRAYVCRADINLGELEPQADAPGAEPQDGTYWLDTASTLWGIQEWNADSVIEGGQTFSNRAPIVITDETQTENTGSLNTNGYSGFIPKKSVGSIGDYAVVATTNLNKVFYRNADTNWVLVGSDPWIKSWPTISATVANPIIGSGSFTINGTMVTVVINPTYTVNDLASDITSLNIPGITVKVTEGKLEFYSDGSSSTADDSTLGGPITLQEDSDGVLLSLGIFTTGQTTATYYPPALQISKHTSIPEFKSTDDIPRPTGSVWIKTTTPNLGAKHIVKKWNNATKLWENIVLSLHSDHPNALYELDRTGGGSNLLTGQLYAQYNVAGDTRPLATFQIFRRSGITKTTVVSDKITDQLSGTLTFKMKSTDRNSNSWSTPTVISALYSGAASDSAILAGAINDAGIPNVSASVVTGNKVEISHNLAGDIWFEDTDGVLSLVGFDASTATNSKTVNLEYAQGTDGTTSPLQLQATLWSPLSYTASDNEVLSQTAEGTLWYNSIVDEVDILVHNGEAFVGYLYAATGESSIASPFWNATEGLRTDPNGPIVSASTPLTQSDGTVLVNGDLWVNTADIENYPKLYKFNGYRTDLPIEGRWFEVDTTDQTTENGILFADARYNTNGANSDEPGDIIDLLETDYVDPDSPDPALYPKGMLLFNLRRSGFNVKKFKKNYINTVDKNIRYNDNSMEDYYPHRWVTESGNREDGAGSFGRKAQRKVIVQSLQALVNSNEEIRDDETRIFNLMACPGYPELIGEMKSLNYDRGLSAFICGDSPFRLAPNGTVLNNWATNSALAVEDNDDGLVTTDPYLAVWYPSGYTSDNFGNNVVVPASHMMLRTLALSDQVSFPWFAPAGTRRGGITNASSTGYITDEGEFKAIALNEGLRDTLYSNNVNPITFVTGAGLISYGQKTRQLAASSLDRINVARLVIYLRAQLKVLAKPYLFEPNDKITRDEIKNAAETLLLELVGLRALYDYLVVCDESNNTPARIDRNELYLDIAIEPVKAVEFIYIPLRLKNTGEIAGG